MADNKKTSLFGSLADKIKSELFEETIPTAKTAVEPEKVVSGTTPYTFGTGAVPPPVGSNPEPVDDKILAVINDGVFTDIDGRTSRFLMFQKMFETLGRPIDPTIALKALQVNDPSFTPANILQDILAHQKLLDAVTAKADQDIREAATERLGGADAKIKQLQEANQQAQAEIERHQKETSERIGKIAECQTQRATDEAAISRAKSRTDSAASSVRAQLQGMQQLFTNLI